MTPAQSSTWRMRTTLACALVLASAAKGQQPEPYLTIDGELPRHHIGQGAVLVEDVNGDGHADIATGAWSTSGRISTHFLYSGADGSVIHKWEFTGALDSNTVSGAGDIDGDGAGDLVMSGLLTSAGQYAVWVRSGKSGATLYEHRSSTLKLLNVAGGGDLNADGVPDWLVREEFLNSSDVFVVGYSGATGLELFRLSRTDTDREVPLLTWSGNFGCAINFAGDVNVDGHDDFIVGDPDARNWQSVRMGGAGLFSGKDRSLLRWFADGALDSRFGESVAGGGDLNSDGVPDLLVGTEFYDNAFSNAGLVLAYSGTDGSLLHRWEGTADVMGLGHVVRFAGDVNGDGAEDAMTATWGRKFARVYSGADGSELMTISTKIGSFNFGESADAGHDVNGDGWPDLVIAEPSWDNFTGRLWVYPGNPVVEVGALTAGQIATVEGKHFASAAPTWLGVSRFGPEPFPIPNLNLIADIAAKPLATGISDDSGKLIWQIPVPSGVQGTTIWLQAVQDSLKSNVVSATIQ